MQLGRIYFSASRISQVAQRADEPPADRLPGLQVCLAKGEKCVYTHPRRHDHPSDHALPNCTDTGYCLPLCWNDCPSDDKLLHHPDTRDTVYLKVGAGETWPLSLACTAGVWLFFSGLFPYALHSLLSAAWLVYWRE